MKEQLQNQLSRVNSDLCPVCESPNISSDNDFTSSCGIGDVTVKCIDCNTSWIEVYRVSAITIKEQGATNENI